MRSPSLCHFPRLVWNKLTQNKCQLLPLEWGDVAVKLRTCFSEDEQNLLFETLRKSHNTLYLLLLHVLVLTATKSCHQTLVSLSTYLLGILYSCEIWSDQEQYVVYFSIDQSSNLKYKRKNSLHMVKTVICIILSMTKQF